MVTAATANAVTAAVAIAFAVIASAALTSAAIVTVTIVTVIIDTVTIPTAALATAVLAAAALATATLATALANALDPPALKLERYGRTRSCAEMHKSAVLIAIRKLSPLACPGNALRRPLPTACPSRTSPPTDRHNCSLARRASSFHPVGWRLPEEFYCHRVSACVPEIDGGVE
jgi:hypothetical protein